MMSGPLSSGLHPTHGKGPETWINEYADFDRVFLAGASAGATIANNIAVRTGTEELDEMTIEGMVLVHPYFGKQGGLKRLVEHLFPTIYDGGNEARIYPTRDLSRYTRLGCERVAVFVVEKDELKKDGVGYVEALRKSG
ncbi:hypothetical protein MLD38_013797 [Melastoma candidum]|uniref:Uncharacterized protein n=1 Tax=Melastoma candidum TaxID=119954 RepID=A0ACB9REE3_9MYRT|nr:hypothetical protein MLD38_013797 [Melastoma candidum]